jgi:Domain of unknown function (DUF4252)
VNRLALLFAAAGLLAGQQFKLDLDHLAAKASNAVDVSLNGSTLKLAARFLDNSDPDEAKVKKLLTGIEGIYIRHFEFKRDNEWTPADAESVRSQLRSPEWSRVVGYKSVEEGENADVYIRSQNEKVSGIAILYTGAREFTVVNISGAIDLDSLVDLSGHMGLPKLRQSPGKSVRKME